MKSLVRGSWKFFLFSRCLLALFVIGLEVDASRAQSSESVPGELLVKFLPGTSRAEMNAAHGSLGATVIGTFRGDPNLFQVKLPDNVAAASARAYYRSRSSVRYAEPNHIVHAVVEPDDPLFPSLWGMAKIEAPGAWDIWTGDGSVVIADIDTGVDYSHSDLARNIWVNEGEMVDFPNDIDDDGNGFVDDIVGWDFVNDDNDPIDDNGHGTHTSGTIAAQGNNGLGVVGVMWQAQIMPLKFLGAGGSGSVANAIRALDYATSMSALISNNSWGCAGQLLCANEALKDAITRAGAAGAIFVAAAGNSNRNVDGNMFDNYNLVAVAATTQTDTRASFSNFGPNSVHLGAPGVGILSTIRNEGYGLSNGTSMAAPHVAGVLGLVRSLNPSLSAADAIAMVLASVDPVGLPVITGGRLNARRAVENAIPARRRR